LSGNNRSKLYSRWTVRDGLDVGSATTSPSQRTIYYYRCLGGDGYRHLKGAVCDNKPIHQEQLDAVVWQEIVQLLDDPSLLQAELDRRLQAAQTTDPLKRHEEAKFMVRCLTAGG
jgi:site-specific DNA recombinase